MTTLNTSLETENGKRVNFVMFLLYCYILKIFVCTCTYKFQNEEKQPNMKCSLRSKPIIEKLQSDVFHLINYDGHQSEVHRVDVVNFQI